MATPRRESTPKREVCVAYVIPDGQENVSGTKDAMRATLRVLQKYWLDQVGKTFVIADDWFHVVDSDSTAEQAVSWRTNVDLIRGELKDRYVDDEDLVITAIEGTSGDAGGSWNIVKMPGDWLNAVRSTHTENPIKLSTELAGWAHEMGHAFGLAHTNDLKATCVAIGQPFDQPAFTLMQQVPQEQLFDYPLADLERRLLLDASMDARLLPMRSDPDHPDRARPHPSAFLRAEHVAPYPESFGRRVTKVEMGSPRTDTSHGYLVQRQGARWEELNHTFQRVFDFHETGRDDWSVYLHDASRDVRLQVDMHRKKVRYAAPGVAWRDQYDVLYAV